MAAAAAVHLAVRDRAATGRVAESDRLERLRRPAEAVALAAVGLPALAI